MVYMLTKLGYIDGKWQTIYGIHTDSMGIIILSLYDLDVSSLSLKKQELWGTAGTAQFFWLALRVFQHGSSMFQGRLWALGYWIRWIRGSNLGWLL